MIKGYLAALFVIGASMLAGVLLGVAMAVIL